MINRPFIPSLKNTCHIAIALLFFIASGIVHAQTAGASALPSPTAQVPNAQVPDWAQPGSAPHVQVAPPAAFHRATTTFHTPIGIFEGQSDVGSAIAPGSASYDAATRSYTIHSAGYNIWYQRDEFRFLWKKM